MIDAPLRYWLIGQSLRKRYARNMPDAEDLVHEAVVRMLEGRRNRPPHVTLPTFLLQTIRSIASRRKVFISTDFDELLAREPCRLDGEVLALAGAAGLSAPEAEALDLLVACADGNPRSHYKAFKEQHGLTDRELKTMLERVKRKIRAAMRQKAKGAAYPSAGHEDEKGKGSEIEFHASERQNRGIQKVRGHDEGRVSNGNAGRV